jgi:hypothetical protein
MTKKVILTALTLLSTLPFANAQERLSREETLKYAFAVSLDLKQLTGTPIPTDVDVKRFVALRDGEYGGLVLPEAKLAAEQIANAKEDVVPVGQLWLYHLTPMREGSAVATDTLRLATVSSEGNVVELPQCALGVRRDSSDRLVLAVFGKGKVPVLTVPLKTLDDKQPQPGIEAAAERESDSGKITLTLAGKYQATIEVTQLDL